MIQRLQLTTRSAARPLPALLAGTIVCLITALSPVGCSDSQSGQSGESGGSAAAEAAKEEKRELAPEFELQTLDGQTVRLSDLRGKTVVIDFWATWCPPCEFQVPELNAFYEAHRHEDDVAVLGISVDVEGADVVSSWTSDKEVAYTVLLQGEALARRFGAPGFPVLYIVTPEGYIDSQHVGLIEVGDLEKALTRLRGDGGAGVGHG